MVEVATLTHSKQAMKKKDEIALLKAFLEPCIDGQSGNIYRRIGLMMGELPVEAKKITVSLDSLRKVFEKLSMKWEKEIEEAIDPIHSSI